MLIRKKILFVARWYPDRHDPMLGLFVQKHASAVQLLHDVAVLYVTADKTLPSGKTMVTHEDFEGIKELRIYFGKSKFELINAFRYAKYYLKGIKKLYPNQLLPDLVHVHILSRTAFPALYLKYFKKIPFVITEHWSRYLKLNVDRGAYSGWLRKFFTRWAVASASAVTTVTKNLADAMQSLGLKNFYYITPNVADTNLFRISEKDKTKRTIKKLVHVSCFDEPAKNIKGIINVIEKLSKKRNDFTIEFIGDGVDFTLVKDYAESTGLVNSIIFFTGLLTGEVLAEKMRDADAMVMFSNYENLPCTIVESICSGVPVISSNVGGISEYLLPEFGSLVQSGDEIGLYNAIQIILNKTSSYQPDLARTFGENNFSLTASAEKFNSIYQRILNI